jgi:hypothetical protein
MGLLWHGGALGNKTRVDGRAGPALWGDNVLYLFLF